MRTDQAGIYQCIASSALGDVTAAASLQVKTAAEAEAAWVERPDLTDLPGMSQGGANPAGKSTTGRDSSGVCVSCAVRVCVCPCVRVLVPVVSPT